MDKQSGAQQLFRLKENECSVPTRNFISTVFIDSHKGHWVFPWRGGIWQIDPVKKTFHKKTQGFIREQGQTKGLVVTAAVEDESGNIWFADLDEGLILYNRKENIFSKPTEKEFKAQYTLTNLLYEKPYIWGATTGFVFRMKEPI